MFFACNNNVRNSLHSQHSIDHDWEMKNQQQKRFSIVEIYRNHLVCICILYSDNPKIKQYAYNLLYTNMWKMKIVLKFWA